MANYADITYADAYFLTHLWTTPWDDSIDANKTKALTMGTQIIDTLSFTGEVTSTTQDNQFPRDDEVTVPTDIQDASCEIALALLDGIQPDKELEAARMLRFTYDAVTTQYKTDVPDHTYAGVPSVLAWRLLIPYLRDSDSFNLSRVT